MQADADRIARHIDQLRQYTATPAEGVTRLSYSREDLDARAYIKKQMALYGLHISEDGLGNIFGKLPGHDADGPSVIVGSHFDSVPNGGAYDGTAGVVAGLEVAALFQENAITPQNPLEVIAMVEEEGSRFGNGLMGSRGIVGDISDQDMTAITDDDGITVAEALQAAGLQSQNLRKRDPKTIEAFLEMHIEQGPVLEDNHLPIGIVNSIVGLTQLNVTVKGQAGHAGTTPMDKRIDPMVTAGKIIGSLPELAVNIGHGTVMTTGKVHVYPNGGNVIPDKVVFTVDIRSAEEQHIEQAVDQVQDMLKDYSQKGIQAYAETSFYIAPKTLDPAIGKLFKDKSEQLSIPYWDMSSGAGHDAMVFSDVAPAGLLFVPSKDGLSHCPEEYSDSRDIAKGVEILYETAKTLTKAT